MIAKTSIVLKSHSVPSDHIPVKPVITPYISEPFKTPESNATSKKTGTKVEILGLEL